MAWYQMRYTSMWLSHCCEPSLCVSALSLTLAHQQQRTPSSSWCGTMSPSTAHRGCQISLGLLMSSTHVCMLVFGECSSHRAGLGLVLCMGRSKERLWLVLVCQDAGVEQASWP